MARKGRVVVMGAGPAGMAAALSIAQTEHEVVLLERYPAARPAGNILNLWPPPIKALGLLGVDTVDLGAPCQSEFRSASGKVRAVVHLPQDVVDQYGGGFIGMLRPQLYRRLLDTLPDGVLRTNTQVSSFEQDDSGVRLQLGDGSVMEADLLVGADGIDSLVRRTLWGDAPKREHNLHIIGGFTFDDTLDIPTGRCVVSHTRTIQGSWTSIRHDGRAGFQWWVLGAFDSSKEFTGDLHETATKMAEGFAFPLPQLVAATDPTSLQRWPIRDRPPLEKWSRGRATLVGDAAHPTSPYAAYGAGMSIEDGYFLGRHIAGVDISDPVALSAALAAYEAPRKPHTAFQVETAYKLGKIFHHIPAPLRPIRDLFFDRTPFLQKMIGDGTPGEILKQIDEIDHAERDFQAKRGQQTSKGQS
jgi:2-polyprenyl-6-methoxyphenol hydroxylase-like FAD-dependent oxidoreductase